MRFGPSYRIDRAVVSAGGVGYLAIVAGLGGDVLYLYTYVGSTSAPANSPFSFTATLRKLTT